MRSGWMDSYPSVISRLRATTPKAVTVVMVHTFTKWVLRGRSGALINVQITGA